MEEEIYNALKRAHDAQLKSQGVNDGLILLSAPGPGEWIKKYTKARQLVENEGLSIDAAAERVWAE